MSAAHLGRAAASLVAALLVVAVAAPAPADAHEVDADVRFVIEDAGHDIGGVTIAVVRGLAPQVVVDNRTDGVLEALDEDGRAFLRIGPDGVAADRNAVAFLDSADPAGLPPGVSVPSDLPPAWAPLRDEPAWGWFDHRLHAEALRFDSNVERTEVLARWELDFRFDGEPFTVSGRTERWRAQGTTLAALTSGHQPVPGVLVQMLGGEVPGISLTASRPLTVLGVDGEPFLRFGPTGVEANQRSATWLLSGRAAAEASGPAELADLAAGGAGEPVWVTVASGASFGWLDPRLAPPDQLPAGTDVPADGYATLGTWQLPLVDGDGETITVSGETRYVALSGTDDARSWGPSLTAAALAGILLVTGLLLRRRRQPR